MYRFNIKLLHYSLMKFEMSFMSIVLLILLQGFGGTMAWTGNMILGFAFLMFGPSPIFGGLIPTT